MDYLSNVDYEDATSKLSLTHFITGWLLCHLWENPHKEDISKLEGR